MTALVQPLKDFARWLGFHFHEPRVFCIGTYALVKCVTCGAESIPWIVSEEKAKAWNDAHPNGVAEYLAIKGER